MFGSFFGLCITQAQCRNISNWGIGRKKRAFEGWVAEVMWFNIRKICGDYFAVLGGRQGGKQVKFIGLWLMKV